MRGAQQNIDARNEFKVYVIISSVLNHSDLQSTFKIFLEGPLAVETTYNRCIFER